MVTREARAPRVNFNHDEGIRQDASGRIATGRGKRDQPL